MMFCVSFSVLFLFQAIAAMMRAQEVDPTNLEVLLALGVSHTNGKYCQLVPVDFFDMVITGQLILKCSALPSYQCITYIILSLLYIFIMVLQDSIVFICY